VFAFVLPPWLADRAGDDAETENAIRGTLLGALAGFFFLATAIAAFWQVRVAQNRLDQERDRSRAQLALDRQGQNTDRFSKAVEQLGHDTVDVRLGGLFALERLGADEPEAFAANVYEILVAFLREHTRPESYGLTKKQRRAIISGKEDIPYVGTDIEAVFTILGRRRQLFNQCVDDLPTHVAGDGPHLVDLDLSDRWLRGANLHGATITNCSFHRARLTDVSFDQGSILIDCDFGDATLSRLQVSSSTLTECGFRTTNLTGCGFSSAVLTDCYFEKATLDECAFMTTEHRLVNESGNVIRTTRTRTILTDCSFTESNLTHCSFFRGEADHLLLHRIESHRGILQRGGTDGLQLQSLSTSGYRIRFVGTFPPVR
jgi:hypothetical protein